MFDLTCLNEFTTEQLFRKGIEVIYEMDKLTDYQEVLQFKHRYKLPLEQFMVILGEMYRRNLDNKVSLLHKIKTFLEEDTCSICSGIKGLDYWITGSETMEKVLFSSFSNMICSSCKHKYDIDLTSINQELLMKRQIELQHHIVDGMKDFKRVIEIKLQEIKLVKTTMLKIMKPSYTQELEDRMNEILHLNGKSRMKDFLTEEQYEFICGNKFYDLSDQEGLLVNFDKMISALSPEFD